MPIYKLLQTTTQGWTMDDGRCGMDDVRCKKL